MTAMKKRLALPLALAMVLSLGAVPALAAPEADMEPTVVLDDDRFTMTVTDYDPEGEWGPAFEVLLENNSDRALVFDLEQAAVNGVMCDPFWIETVPAGQEVYSDICWYPDELTQIGVNYIQTVTALVCVREDETYDEIFKGMKSWEVTVGETDQPAVEPPDFGGFEPVEVLSGDTVMTVVGYDPAGSYDEGPALTIYMENDTDSVVHFTADDVAINGFGCDPYWSQIVLPGMAAYGTMEWWLDSLEDSHIETVQTVQFKALALEDDSWDELADPVTVTLDLAG